ncbi:MAG TPA: rhomboid family intramembrane serine protease [Polyangia bacterium]|jgi:membrane associated rhomboid family serine protease
MARFRGGQWAALKPERGVMAAMIVLTAICLVINVGGAPIQLLAQHLVLRPRTALGWEPWQLVTNGFIEPDFIDLLLTFVMFIFFGNPLEQRLGTRAFWKVFVGGIIGGSLVAAVVGRIWAPDVPILGAQPAMTALLVAFGALWAGQQVSAYGVAQMSATTMTWIFVGINVLACVKAMRADWHIGLLELSAVAGAGLAGWLLTRRGGIDIGGLGRSFDRMKMWRLKRRYRVLTGGREGPPNKRWLN